MIEFERTFLLKNIPFKLDNYPYKELIDHYIPRDFEHPKLRLRKRGDKYEITKKTLVQDGDSSIQREQTIDISKKEYEALASLPNKHVRKFRYYVPYNGLTLEIDVFKDDLDGLILMDVEFDDSLLMNAFEMPSFCVADVSQEDLFAGGLLCGKTYASLSSLINHYSGE